MFQGLGSIRSGFWGLGLKLVKFRGLWLGFRLQCADGLDFKV